METENTGEKAGGGGGGGKRKDRGVSNEKKRGKKGTGMKGKHSPSVWKRKQGM